MKESTIWKECLLAVGKLTGIRVFRNNVGTAWVGRSIRLKKGQSFVADGNELVIYDPRPLIAGLHKGSGDGIGWREIEITQDMVGKKLAQFVSLETKTKTGRVSTDQQNWARNVREAGGVAIIARSPDDITKAFKQE